MTHEEYEKKKLDLRKRYLRDSFRSAVMGTDTDETLNSRARALAIELDALALEIDPLEGYELRKKP